MVAGYGIALLTTAGQPKINHSNIIDGHVIVGQRKALEFTLYSRSNCPLCEAMEDELTPFIQKYRITVRRRYIDNQPDLEKRYGTKVPVLTLDENTLCEYFLDTEALLRVLSPENHTTG
jgi:hypothetical protein